MARRRKASPQRSRERARSVHRVRKRRRRAGKRTLHYLLLLIFVVSAGVLLSLTVFFKIEDIRVTGVDKYPPEDIIAASGIQKEDNLLRVRTHEAQQRILELFPYLESVEIARLFPPAIEIRVVQAEPFGAIIDGDEIAFITQSGKLLERGRLMLPPGMPLIRGIGFRDKRPGEMLDEAYAEQLGMLQYLFESAQRVGFGPITNVDVSDRLNMKMVYEARLVLELGSEADMDYKLTFLNEVISQLEPDDQALLDAAGAKDKRVYLKWGRVENGEFYPLGQDAYDEVVGQDATVENGPQDNPDS